MSASMAEGIAGVLREHQPYPRALRHMECHGCDWKSEEAPAILTIGQRATLTAAHQAEVLAANGYGDVREARASALLDAADERYKDGLFVFGLATRQKLRARAVTERGGE